MASGVYNRGKAVMLAAVNWSSTNVGVLLVTSTYTPNADHNVVTDITNELSGGGYARQTTVSSRAVTEDDTNDRVDLVAAKVTFPSLGAAAGTPKYAIIYDNTNGTDGTRDLLCWVDLGVSPPTPDGNNYEIRWNGTDGTGVVMRLT